MAVLSTVVEVGSYADDAWDSISGIWGGGSTAVTGLDEAPSYNVEEVQAALEQSPAIARQIRDFLRSDMCPGPTYDCRERSAARAPYGLASGAVYIAECAPDFGEAGCSEKEIKVQRWVEEALRNYQPPTPWTGGEATTTSPWDPTATLSGSSGSTAMAGVPSWAIWSALALLVILVTLVGFSAVRG